MYIDIKCTGKQGSEAPFSILNIMLLSNWS